MNIEHIIMTYGYPALFLGVFFEGETVLILAGFLARRGYFALSPVVAVSFFGALFYTLLFFFIGKKGTGSFIDKNPVRRYRTRQIRHKLEEHPNLTMIGFRFLYGFRTITPFVVGISGFDAKRFIFLNAVGTLIWAVAYGVVGYLSGEFFNIVFDNMKRYEVWFSIGIVFVGIAFWVLYKMKTRKKIKTTPLLTECSRDTDAA